MGTIATRRTVTLDCETRHVFVVHGTKKFLDRAGRTTGAPTDRSTTALGSWYATALFWKPQVALFVNETTLLPVLIPLAPAAGVVGRFPAALEVVLRAHDVSDAFVAAERAKMREHRLAKTANRSVVGIINEFAFLGGVHRAADGADDLVALSLRLAETPCGPLYGSHVSPDRELVAFVERHTGATSVKRG